MDDGNSLPGFQPPSGSGANSTRFGSGGGVWGGSGARFSWLSAIFRSEAHIIAEGLVIGGVDGGNPGAANILGILIARYSISSDLSRLRLI